MPVSESTSWISEPYVTGCGPAVKKLQRICQQRKELDAPAVPVSACRRVTLTLKADQERLLAHSWACSIVIYFVRTVWELIRLKRETGPPARMHEEMLRVFAVFFDGLEIMVTGAESNDAQTRPGMPSVRWSEGDTRGSPMSSASWKLFDLAVPATWRYLKLATMLASRDDFWSGPRSPFSVTMHMASCWDLSSA